MMNNGSKKKVGLKLLQQTQVLSQNAGITTEERNAIVAHIRAGMATGNFEKLKNKLFDILEKTTLPEVVEEMILNI